MNYNLILSSFLGFIQSIINSHTSYICILTGYQLSDAKTDSSMICIRKFKFRKSDSEGFCQLNCHLFIGLRKKNHKFLSTPSSGQASRKSFVYSSFQHIRKHLKNYITFFMTICIIN